MIKALIHKVLNTAEHQKTKGVARSKDWPKVRAEHIKNHPSCAACGGTKKVEVHHIRPFHVHPELELDPNNLISLCEGKKTICCHLIVGHGGSYKDVNPNVKEMASQIYDLLTKKQITE